jgi:alpha-N-arabinofuranosidase
MFPAVPIFHSVDLVNWKQIGHVLDRKTQLRLQNAGFSEGIYAPVIRYNPYNDTFYMITTHIGGGVGNMVVKTKDPSKGWSDPIILNFGGIDPSLFFDDNGKAYVVHNDAPDKGKELYDGHRVIKIWEYDLENDQVIPGTDKIIVNGGVDISQKPIWIEGPHIYKKNGLYYLMCAEGGTGSNHSEVIFVSDSATGRYIPAPENPILTQRALNPKRKNKVEWAGHADIIETPDGKYYGVFLATRPNECDRVNTGRETYILPIDWTGKYPLFVGGLEPIAPKQQLPVGVKNLTGRDGFMPNGNFKFEDDFLSGKLDLRWIAMRGPREDFVRQSNKGLTILPFDVTVNEQKPTSCLFFRQQHIRFTAATTLNYQPETESELAGLVCYQSEQNNYVMGVTRMGTDDYIIIRKTQQGKAKVLARKKIKLNGPVTLQVKAEGDNYQFSYVLKKGNPEDIGGVVSGDILSSNIAGGFTGNLIGLYATRAQNPKWVATWSTANFSVGANDMPPAPGLNNHTIRQIVRVSIGGEMLKLKLSNLFGEEDLEIQSVSIAEAVEGSSIDNSTIRQLTFRKKKKTNIAANAEVFSDPVKFKLKPGSKLAITINFGNVPRKITGHPGSRTTSYILHGNQSASADFSAAVKTDHWYTIGGIDVQSSHQAATIAVIGNSITDGRGSGTNKQNRWTDILSQRLLENNETKYTGVINLGIGGNCVVRGGMGPTALSRFNRDVISQNGVKWLIILEGINDIGGLKSADAVPQLVQDLKIGYMQIIDKAHANGIKVYGATLLPFGKSGYDTEYRQVARDSINNWIRNSGMFDAVIDFDNAMRDSVHLRMLQSQFQGDFLHPNEEGYKKMGEYVDLNLFR